MKDKYENIVCGVVFLVVYIAFLIIYIRPLLKFDAESTLRQWAIPQAQANQAWLNAHPELIEEYGVETTSLGVPYLKGFPLGFPTDPNITNE